MTAKPTYEKSTCCIPGCPRWSRRFPGEWLCALHWKMLPRTWRAILNRTWKREKEAYDRYDAIQDKPTYLAARDAAAAEARLWQRAKRHVIFQEAGI